MSCALLQLLQLPRFASAHYIGALYAVHYTSRRAVESRSRTWIPRWVLVKRIPLSVELVWALNSEKWRGLSLSLSEIDFSDCPVKDLSSPNGVQLAWVNEGVFGPPANAKRAA